MTGKAGVESADGKLDVSSVPANTNAQFSTVGETAATDAPALTEVVAEQHVFSDQEAPAIQEEDDGGDDDKPKLLRDYSGRNPRNENEREKRMLSIMKVVIKRNDSFTTLDLKNVLTAVYRNWEKAGKVTAVTSDISSAIKTMGFEVTGEVSLGKRGRSPLIYQLIPQNLTFKGKMIYLSAMKELEMEPEVFGESDMKKLNRMFKNRAAKKQKAKQDEAQKAKAEAAERAAKKAAEQASKEAEQKAVELLAAKEVETKRASTKRAKSEAPKNTAKKQPLDSQKVKNSGFQLGQRVKWTSQSSGYDKEKVGVVVYVADLSNSRASPLDIAGKKFANHRRMFDGSTWQKDAVLVEVRDGKTADAKPKLYMPRVSALCRVNE